MHVNTRELLQGCSEDKYTYTGKEKEMQILIALVVVPQNKNNCKKKEVCGLGYENNLKLFSIEGDK